MPRPDPWVGARVPRLWQAEALPKCVEAVDEGRFGVVVAATGTGKSVLIAEICHQLVGTLGAGAIVVVTPTRKLVGQLGETLRGRLGAKKVGLYYTDAKEWSRPVVVCCNASARSLARALKQARVPVALLLCDEAHRTEAATLRLAVDSLDPERVLGFTATPFRSEEDESLQLFEEELVRYDIRAALRDGVIVPWRVVPWTRGGKVDDAAVAMIQGAEGPGVCNAVSVADAEAFVLRLIDAGVSAKAVHSRLTEAEQERRIGLFQKGEIRCIVYPSLLSEGVDIPEIRWMCLRRKVTARVRFIQEAGRGLRTSPGKVECIFFDLHGLFREFSLVGESALGAVEEGAASAPAEEGSGSAGPSSPSGPGELLELVLTPLAAVDAWAAQLRAAAEVDGLVQPRLAFGAGARAKGPSERQLQVIRKMRWAGRWMPAPQKAFLDQLVEKDAMTTMGAASDLLDVLMALAARKLTWAPRLPIWLPDVDLQSVRAQVLAGPLYAAGLCWRGAYVVVVQRGLRVLHQAVRVAREGEGSLAATVEAALWAAGQVSDVETDPVYLDMGAAIGVLVGRTKNPEPATAAVLARSKAPRFKVEPCDKSPAKEACFREAVRFQKRQMSIAAKKGGVHGVVG